MLVGKAEWLAGDAHSGHGMKDFLGDQVKNALRCSWMQSCW